MSHRASGRVLVMLSTIALAAIPDSTLVAAQNPCFSGSVEAETGCSFSAPRWVGEFATLSANGVIGGLTAGLVQRFRGGSFADGFAAGLLGGSATYVGKRIAVERFAGAGLIGRSVSAAGASVVRNAGDGDALLSRLTLPVGPVWLEVLPGRGIHARVDAAALGWLVYGLAEPELHIDIGESVSAGAAVFRTRGKLLAIGGDDVHAAGVTNAGVIYLANVPAYGESFERRSLAHERVHVLQEDALAIQWTDPLASAILEDIRAPAVLGRFVSFNLSTELLRVGGRLIARHEERPWELEPIFLAR